jgi:hypothetical protein
LPIWLRRRGNSSFGGTEPKEAPYETLIKVWKLRVDYFKIKPSIYFKAISSFPLLKEKYRDEVLLS